MSKNLNKDLTDANIDPKTLGQLLNIASKKLGVSPEALQKSLQSGELERQISNSSDPRFAGLKKAMQDPNKALNDPQAAALFNKLKK